VWLIITLVTCVMIHFFMFPPQPLSLCPSPRVEGCGHSQPCSINWLHATLTPATSTTHHTPHQLCTTSHQDPPQHIDFDHNMSMLPCQPPPHQPHINICHIPQWWQDMRRGGQGGGGMRRRQDEVKEGGRIMWAISTHQEKPFCSKAL